MLLWLNNTFASCHAPLAVLIVVAELGLCAVIIAKIAYTEIDWVAYMQEVTYHLNGERNYMLMKGDTGPLVYPAGFVYIFSALYKVTDNGTNILRAQGIFAGVYAMVLSCILYIYSLGKKMPLWSVIFLLLSKRIHSIFVLRMFNDCVAVLFGYVALALFLNQQWRVGCVAYSVAVSIKMNILLQAPGLLLVLLLSLGYFETFVCLCICAAVQLIVGFEFLSTFPLEYLQRSFDVGRVFMHVWTVNLKFLAEEIFVRKELGIALLLATVIVMILFARKWIRENFYGNRRSSSKEPNAKDPIIGPRRVLSSHFIIMALFTSNFVGVVFARSLHYQFYVWYFHMLPYLLFHGMSWHGSSKSIFSCNSDVAPKFCVRTALLTLLKVALIVCIEVAFNVYPSTWWSSTLLQVAHLSILCHVYFQPAPALLEEPSATTGAVAHVGVNNSARASASGATPVKSSLSSRLAAAVLDGDAVEKDARGNASAGKKNR